MICKVCGKTLPDNAKFCEGCGSRVMPEAAPAPAQPAYTPNAQPYPRPDSVYAAPGYQAPAKPQTPPSYSPFDPAAILNKPLSVGQYIGMFILSAIPLVGFILTLVWAFGSDVNKNKKNYARAVLIMALIAIGLSIIIALLFGGLIGSMMYY